MTERSLFRIYSMTKRVTAVAVMMLFEQGRFSLSDPVSKYLPEFARRQGVAEAGGATRPPSRPVTVRTSSPHVRPEPSHVGGCTGSGVDPMRYA